MLQYDQTSWTFNLLITFIPLFIDIHNFILSCFWVSNWFILYVIRVCQMFCNILVRASLWCLYYVTKRNSVIKTNYLSKGLILLAFRRQIRNHRLKYIKFKSSSSKYNEVFHYYLHLIKELPVYRNTSLGLAVW